MIDAKLIIQALYDIVCASATLTPWRLNMADTRRPNFIARAKETPDSDRWITIGAAWEFKEKEGYALRISNMPTQWDGTLILVPPLDKEEPEPEPVKGKAKR